MLNIDIPELKAKLLNNVITDSNGCWIWQRSKNLDGYGSCTINGMGGMLFGTHRLAYLLFNGEIPKNQVVCHHCDNPSCINPQHLFLGSRQLNALDMRAKNRHPNKRTSFDEVRYIRQKFKTMDGTEKERYRILADEFGYNPYTIKNIVKRRTFANVHDVPRPILNRVEEQPVEYRA